MKLSAELWIAGSIWFVAGVVWFLYGVHLFGLKHAATIWFRRMKNVLLIIAALVVLTIIGRAICHAVFM